MYIESTVNEGNEKSDTLTGWTTSICMSSDVDDSDRGAGSTGSAGIATAAAANDRIFPGLFLKPAGDEASRPPFVFHLGDTRVGLVGLVFCGVPSQLNLWGL